MRLAHARTANKQEPSLLQWVFFDELFSNLLRTSQRFALSFRIKHRQFAVLESRWDARRRQQALAAVFHPAFAAHYFALFAAFDGLPSAAAADGACLGHCGHEFESTATPGSAQ